MLVKPRISKEFCNFADYKSALQKEGTLYGRQKSTLCLDGAM